MLPIETHKTKGTNKKPVMSFVFLSLVLILLCFFLFLFSTSSFEQTKIDAVGNSLRKAFLSPKNIRSTEVSFEANAVQTLHQSQIKKVFSDSSIKQNPNGIFVLFNEKDIFKTTSDELSSTINIWTKQIKTLLNVSALREKYTLEILLFEDLKLSEDYPVHQHLLTKRIAKLTEKLNKEEINNYRIRIEKGNASKVILFFRQKESL